MSDQPEDTTTGEPTVDVTAPEAITVVGGTVTAAANDGHYDQNTGEFK